MKNKNKQEKMRDLLIPILFVIVILPMVVRLAVYSCGYGEYVWYPSEDMVSDLFCYFKSYIFDIVAIIALIVLGFRMALYREKTRSIKEYIPMFIYGIFVIISTIFSVNAKASLEGNFESFESCLVLLGYVVMSFYTYQIMDDDVDYQIIWKGISALTILLTIVGLFQMFKCDLLDFTFIQRLIMSQEYFYEYGGELESAFSGNNVYLTLYNPNYAGIVLVMLFAVIFVVFLTEKNKNRKILYAILAIIVAVLNWFTYSRTSLVTMLMVACIAIFALRKKIEKKVLKLISGGFVIGFVLLVGIDALMGFKYISKIFESNTREPLESILTDEEGIHIIYDDNKYLVWFDKKQAYCLDETSEELTEIKPNQDTMLDIGEGTECFYLNDIQTLEMLILDTTLEFVNEDGEYFYQNPYGKLDSMVEVDKVSFGGLEYLASARGYIWSRTLPLLPQFLIAGSGPDTYPEVFPQNDYAGKVVYSDMPTRIIEKAHNDYLTKWIQTGFMSVVAIIAFYIIVIFKGGKAFLFINKSENITINWKYKMGLGAYLACISYMIASLFNDSTIQTAPLFWVFMGLTLSAIEKTEK